MPLPDRRAPRAGAKPLRIAATVSLGAACLLAGAPASGQAPSRSWAVSSGVELTTPAAPALDESLSQAWAAAGNRDPAVAAARAQRDAARERVGLARAAGAPTARIGATTNRQRGQINGGPSVDVDGGTASLNLAMPLYRPQVGAAVEQAGFAESSSAQQQIAAEQDLLLRVALAYLDVLVGIENLRAIAAQKAATAAQLAAAQRSLDVGTATIVDPSEARSRYDLVIAQEIAATTELATRRTALAQLTGRLSSQYRRLPAEAVLPQPRPSVLDEWLQTARERNPKTARARHELQVAQREIERRRLGARPSLDLVGSAGREVNPSVQFFGTRTNSAQVGLTFSWPIWDGGTVDAGVREAIALTARAAAEVEAAEREAELEVRRLFRRLGSGIAMISALQNAERSAETTLRSTQRAWEVGVRVNQDVLDAQQQLFLTRRDLARARYEFIGDSLRIRRAAGVLEEADIERLSALLSDPVDAVTR